MRLAKVTAATLLTILALGAGVSAAHAIASQPRQGHPGLIQALGLGRAENDSDDDFAGSGTGHGKNHHEGASHGADPLVMPPVVIKPEDGFDDEDSGWTPPADSGSVTPTIDPTVDPQILNIQVGTQSQQSTSFVPPSSSETEVQARRHHFVVSPVSPAEHPSLPGTQSLPGARPSQSQLEERVDPSRNAAVVINPMRMREQSPLQEFIDTTLVVMAILGALSLGLVSVLVRSAKVAKSSDR